MTNRITGTNSGIDVDTVVKQSLSTQQNKIDKAYQQQMVYQYQQEQLKSIISDVQDFYDKYLDILSGDSLLKSTAYETVKFTGTDSSGKASTAVTAKGFAGADVTDYKVTVTQLASKANATISDENIKGQDKISITVGDKTIQIDTKKKENSEEIDLEKTASAINTELKKNGINVTAKYSKIAGGIVIESGDMGQEASFSLKVGSGTEKTYQGQNAKGVIEKDGKNYEFSEKSNVITVDNIQFTLNSETATGKDSKVAHLVSGEVGNITTITSGGIATTIKNGDTTTTKTYSDGIKITRTGDIFSVTTDLTELTHVEGETELSDDGKTITSKDKKTVTTKELNDDGTGKIITKKTLEDGTIITTTKTISKDSEGKLSYDIKTGVEGKFDHLTVDSKGAKVNISSSDGKTNTIIENGITTTTQVQTDGSIKKTIGNDDYSTVFGGITLSGETDISQLKDTIVNFVNDYNKVMETINEKLWETRDRDYMPLTEAQKEDMSESEITAWEKKAQTGLLRNDSDLRRIQSAMKSAMSSMMSSTGLTLESIGIEPVDNYTTKNGMYKIDEDKLTKALTNNSEEVKDLFTRSAGSEKDSNGNLIDKGGVLTQLQSVLKNEFKSSSSSLSKRVGFEGTSTESSNTLSKNISKQKTLVKELKSKYTTKETALYNKYSALEVMLEKLNAQSNSLYSMLGLS
ncbi:flagellar filament capping protein FliD [Clostridium butyricum]|uniref:flagellar filament capping protein FliD n=1 Tax=Clostridium butyricum TaxID=1492 RepID=UPI0002CA7AAA|nr:flagellar filament capping protein FliD [Clostridium butyricum]EMU53510.1 hypothetical protein CBDKU1_24590 [Clostridium butyricum DKU-01]